MLMQEVWVILVLDIMSKNKLKRLAMDYTKEEKLISHIIQMMKAKAMGEAKHQITKRSAHAKTLAVLKGYLKIESKLPASLKTELFKEGAIYPAIIRLSNSSVKDKKDFKKDVRGFAIKIQVNNQIQDLILVSTKHMPLRHMEGFEAALCILNGVNPIASMIRLCQNIRWSELIKLILTRKHETSPLDISYYSMTPYACNQEVVKYRLMPTSHYHSHKPFWLTATYLRDNMKKHLKTHRATFDLMIQLQKPGMPIEDVSATWSERESPFIKVGELMIKPQAFDTPKRWAMGEKLSYSPGNTLVSHRPIGELNRARVRIYQEMAHFRKQRNRKTLDNTNKN